MRGKTPPWASIIELTGEIDEELLSKLPCDVFMYLRLLDSAANEGRHTNSYGALSHQYTSAAAGLSFLREQCSSGNAYVAKSTLDNSYSQTHPGDPWTMAYNLVLHCAPPINGQTGVLRPERRAVRWELMRYDYPPLIITNIRAPPPPGWKDVNFAAIPRLDLSRMVAFMYRNIMHPAAHHPHLATLTVNTVKQYRDQFFYLPGLDLIPEDVIEDYFARRPPVPAKQSTISRILHGRQITTEEADTRLWKLEAQAQRSRGSLVSRLFRRKPTAAPPEEDAGGDAGNGWDW